MGYCCRFGDNGPRPFCNSGGKLPVLLVGIDVSLHP